MLRRKSIPFSNCRNFPLLLRMRKISLKQNLIWNSFMHRGLVTSNSDNLVWDVRLVKQFSNIQFDFTANEQQVNSHTAARKLIFFETKSVKPAPLVSCFFMHIRRVCLPACEWSLSVSECQINIINMIACNQGSVNGRIVQKSVENGTFLLESVDLQAPDVTDGWVIRLKLIRDCRTIKYFFMVAMVARLKHIPPLHVTHGMNNIYSWMSSCLRRSSVAYVCVRHSQKLNFVICTWHLECRMPQKYM